MAKTCRVQVDLVSIWTSLFLDLRNKFSLNPLHTFIKTKKSRKNRKKTCTQALASLYPSIVVARSHHCFDIAALTPTILFWFRYRCSYANVSFLSFWLFLYNSPSILFHLVSLY